MITNKKPVEEANCPSIAKLFKAAFQSVILVFISASVRSKRIRDRKTFITCIAIYTDELV